MAITFWKGQPVASFGIDEAMFSQLVSIADLLHFCCCVVRSDPETHVFRVLSINVLDMYRPGQDIMSNHTSKSNQSFVICL